MRQIQSKDTSPELLVRSFLHKAGIRYRLHGVVAKKIVEGGLLPGKPDVVLAKFKTAIFVNGCFWHKHPHCKKAAVPKTNVQYWREKIDRNVERDKVTMTELRRLHWKVIVLWECQVKKKGFEHSFQKVLLKRKLLPARLLSAGGKKL